MKFFDLELGGLGSMPQGVFFKDTDGNEYYVGGSTKEACRKSKATDGYTRMVYGSTNAHCNKRGDFETVYVKNSQGVCNR
jgi:hypothetical protein